MSEYITYPFWDGLKDDEHDKYAYPFCEDALAEVILKKAATTSNFLAWLQLVINMQILDDFWSQQEILKQIYATKTKFVELHIRNPKAKTLRMLEIFLETRSNACKDDPNDGRENLYAVWIDNCMVFYKGVLLLQFQPNKNVNYSILNNGGDQDE